jgi:large subunit GTPase 1
MVLAKSKKSVGLGNSLMNDRFGKGKSTDMHRGNAQQGIERTGVNGERVCSMRLDFMRRRILTLAFSM